jgi:DNA-binding transcriptional LysR family regulator
LPLDAPTRRRLKLRELDIFIAVVEARGMRKAAEQLHVSQPAVSKAIADLERTLKVPLLDRNARGVEPTDYGRVLLKRGIAVFDELREGIKDIEFMTDPAAGEVRIGSVPPIAANFVSAVIDRLSRRHPRIVFQVVASQTESLHRELTDRKVDFLIAERFGPLTDEQLGFEWLYDESYGVVAGAQSPWVRRRKIDLTELANEPWVLPPPDSAPGSIAKNAFLACGLDYPRVAVVTFPREVRMSLVATGRFLTIAPASVARFPTSRPEFKVLPVDLRIPHVANGIVTVKGRTLSPVARLFIEHAREVAKPLARRKG